MSLLAGVLLAWACSESSKEPADAAGSRTNIEAVLSQATELHGKQRYADAIAVLEGALGEHGGNPELHYNLGVMRGSMNDHEGAVRDFEQALLYEPEHAGAHRAVANAYTRLGRFEPSLAHLEFCLHADPGDSACRWLMGSNLSALGRYEEAVEHLRQAALVRQEANTWFELGLAYRRLGQLDNAAYAFHQALGIDRLHLPSMLNYGQVLTALGRKDDGDALLQTHQHLAKMFDRIETLERMADSQDATPGVFLELAELNLAREDLAEAERTYRHAIERYGELPPLALGLGAFLVQEKRATEAAGLVDAILEGDPSSAPGYYLKGLLELDGGNTTAAEQSFAHSMELHPWTADLFIDLGTAYRERGFLGPSEKALRIAVRSDASNPRAHLGLARTLVAQGRPREADFVIREALELEPSSPEAWQLFAVLRAEAGDRDGARAALTNALVTMRPRLLRAGGPEQVEREFLEMTDSPTARQFFVQAFAQFQQPA